MVVKIHYNKNADNSVFVELAIDELNGIQNYFHFIKTADVINEQKNFVLWNEAKLLIREHDEGYNIHIIEKPFNDNWFSHEDSTHSVITTASWNEYFAPPSLKAYLIYQIAQSVVNFELNLSEINIMRFVHESPEGCMFDFCGQKSDIKYGMKTGAICPKCRADLSEFGLEKEAICDIEKILDYVRKISIGRATSIKPKQVYIVQHYQNYGGLNNALEYSIKPALECFDLLPFVGHQAFDGEHYFNKILNDISASKMVIVLIDCTDPLNNQNAYLEYGIAKGMGKDTFIICERDFIDELPSDLKGIQIIAYDKDNFPKLKEILINSLESLLNLKALIKNNL